MSLCGFIGSIGRNVSKDNISSALNGLKKRGPDEHRIEEVSKCAVLGHARLDIVGGIYGAQPAMSHDGRYALVFNGEIYNHRELAAEFGLADRGSDTDILLQLLVLRRECAVDFLRGMFAFGFVDVVTREVLLCRDEFGIKPLYYGQSDVFGNFTFCSQLRPLRDGGFFADPSDDAYEIFDGIGFLIGGSTWLKGVHQLTPGTCVTFGFDGVERRRKTFRYDPAKLESSEFSFRNVLLRHAESQKQVGVLLSAGIDSTAILKTYCDILGAERVIGFTIGLKNDRGSCRDEIPLAKQLCESLGVAHMSEYLSDEDFMLARNKIFDDMDSPSIDGVNTWFACRLAKKSGVRVVLSGVGADEFLFGYSYYRRYYLVKLVVLISKLVPINQGSMFLRAFKLRFLWGGHVDPKVYWLVKRLSFSGLVKFFSVNGSHFKTLILRVLDQLAPDNHLGRMVRPMETCAYLDRQIYLVDQLLRDSDWASMSHGVELRTPFCDPVFLRLAQNSSFASKADFFRKQGVLLPEFILRKKKQGFGVPFLNWISMIKQVEPLEPSRKIWTLGNFN